jgi:hypothetical protein
MGLDNQRELTVGDGVTAGAKETTRAGGKGNIGARHRRRSRRCRLWWRLNRKQERHSDVRVWQRPSILMQKRPQRQTWNTNKQCHMCRCMGRATMIERDRKTTTIDKRGDHRQSATRKSKVHHCSAVDAKDNTCNCDELPESSQGAPR